MFSEKDFKVAKKSIDKDLADFIYNYFMLKRECYQTLVSKGWISEHTPLWGTYEDKQVPNTYSFYADICMETLLQKLLSEMEMQTGLNLVPTYSYARIYKKGDVLERHIDRASCAISCTMFLGGEKWPIYLQDKEGTEHKVDLEQGDMLIYKGDKLDHSRDKFEGEHCVQVFLHYNDKEDYSTDHGPIKYDGRLHLGLPKGMNE